MGLFGPECQSCGMPMKRDEKGGGTNADGSLSMEYCSRCWQGGKFTQPELDVEQMKKIVREKMAEMGVPKFVARILSRNLPKLRRWRGMQIRLNAKSSFLSFYLKIFSYILIGFICLGVFSCRRNKASQGSGCGIYEITFEQVPVTEREGNWSIKGYDGKILFNGEWERGYEFFWSPDCNKLAMTIHWGSNMSDSMVYDLVASKKWNPTEAVDIRKKFSIPGKAEVLHRYDAVKGWKDNSTLLVEINGDWAKPFTKFRGNIEIALN